MSATCDCTALASPPNTLNCSAVATCKSKCGLVSESAVCAARARGPNPIPSGVGKAQSPFSTNPADNLPGGPNQALNNIGSSIQKCVSNLPQCAAGSCPIGPVTLPIPCWGAVLAGIVVLVLVVMVLSRRR